MILVLAGSPAFVAGAVPVFGAGALLLRSRQPPVPDESDDLTVPRDPSSQTRRGSLATFPRRHTRPPWCPGAARAAPDPARHRADHPGQRRTRREPGSGRRVGPERVAISGDGRVVGVIQFGGREPRRRRYQHAGRCVRLRPVRPDLFARERRYWRRAIGGASAGSGIALSGDGQIVAFTSAATNLVAGDSNGIADIFVHDRATAVTTRVSVASNGAQGQGVGARRRPSLSADGRFVAFDSEMTNLVPGDTNATSDVFVHDRVSGQTTRVSVATGGAQATGGSVGSLKPSLSADGRYVAFSSDPHDPVTGDTNGSGTCSCTTVPPTSPRGSACRRRRAPRRRDSFNVPISADGRYVAFESKARSPGDTNGGPDMFVHDRNTGDTVRVKRVATGGAAGRRPTEPRPRILAATAASWCSSPTPPIWWPAITTT